MIQRAMRRLCLSPATRSLLAAVAIASVTTFLTGSHSASVSLRDQRLETTDSSGVFYVDVNSLGGPCDDSGPGNSPATPWCTIARTNSELRAGDTAYFRAGEYHESIAPARDGTADLPITYTAFSNETVVIEGVRTAIELVGRSYVAVDGLQARAVDRYVTLDASHHIRIGSCRFSQHNNTGGWPTGIIFKNNSHHNRLHDSVIGGVGYSTADDDKGCVMNLGVWEDADDHSDRNLIERNTFYRGGHHVLAISSNYNVVRDNYFHNENWMACERTETGGTCGNRNIIFEYDPSNVTWNVVEGNRFAFAGVPPDQNTSAGLSLRTPHNIVRRNEFYYCDGPGMGISTLTGLWDASDNHVYHNVFYHNGYPALPGVESWKEAGLLVAHHGSGTIIQDLAIKNNVFHDNKTHGIMFYYVDASAHVVEGNWIQAGDPGFADLSGPADPDDPTAPNFQLRSDSPCIDAGSFLTHVAATGSGRDIPVADAGFFSDGRGIVRPDEIQLEDGDRVEIIAIDYERNVITVDRPTTFAIGQGVSLQYEGSAPDIGAHERPVATVPTYMPLAFAH